MNSKTKRYTSEEITMLSKALHPNKDAYEWLKNNSCKELAALSDVLLHNNKSALTWLHQYKYNTLTDFLGALNDRQSSFDSLMENDSREWAAVISVLDDHSAAIDWLTKNKLDHFLMFAKALLIAIKTNDRNKSTFGLG